MCKTQNTKIYDLRERTLKFSKAVRSYVKQLPRTLSNLEDARQLVKASGSVGANYIEAEEAISNKDFVVREKYQEKKQKKVDIGWN